jgi:lipoteichoic acid synthase
MKKGSERIPSCTESGLVSIVSLSVAAISVMFLVRARLVGTLFRGSLTTPLAAMMKALVASYYDVLFLVSSSAPFIMLSLLLKQRPLGQRVLRCIFACWISFVVASSLANMSVIKYLGKPFTYQWLYYSDFLKSMPAQQAILANISVQFCVAVAGAVAIFFLILWSAYRLTMLAARSQYKVAIALLAVPVIVVYLAFSRWQVGEQKLRYAQIANPIVAFAESLATKNLPVLYTMPTTVGTSDFEVPSAFVPVAAISARPVQSDIKNVLLVVLESTPAKLVGLYGSSFPTTPHLDAHRTQSLVFLNVHAHWPTTTSTLVSLLTSTYPWPAAKYITSQYPDITLTAISTELKKYGYRTSFFNSADLRFQNTGTFLAYRDFDVVKDYYTIPCSSPVKQNTSRETFSTVAWMNLDGIDDACTADMLLDWIGQVPERPFFAIMWTMMTHYPYFSPQKETKFSTDNREFYRYLNALRHGDEILGKILAELDTLGLAKSTLVVVLGDHGESFGEHGERGHISQLYQENVHIPLVFINPDHFRGETSAIIGGIVDIAPTVMDMLGLPPAPNWQGRSLFAHDRPQRTYFFTPLGELLFGYRDGNLKYIYNASQGSFEIYDLAKDPDEQQNLFDGNPNLQNAILERLAAWVQYQDHFIRGMGVRPN